MISAYSFGKICVSGTWYKRDLLISRGKIFPDWWRRNGHVCDVEDIAEILADGPDILILGQGTPGMMRTTQGLRQFLHHQGIKLIEQPTAEAVTTFNNLHRQDKVAAGFHLTC